MKSKYLQIRISERRLNKFRLYAAQKDKTMTAIIEDFIDSLKLENGETALHSGFPSVGDCEPEG
ncbi:hypothetical protein G7B40_038705 [Aetokthonos hydrillicola Thurmond2011]|jgi:hypothetical protein|uniref:Uncharacterized protein n=1 Tax=Aetokthonos hydrillicola Thurmond2011 TaxID=2712845 RepID=A0AAP5IF50_9CYAN|nr:hypothetical protein [Aetokthonos hydrillicola Thurmond2011]